MSEVLKLSRCYHIAYSNKATHNLKDAKEIYSLLLKEQIGIYSDRIKSQSNIIAVGLIYNLLQHRYEVVSMIYNIATKNLEIDIEYVSKSEELKTTNEQVLIFLEILDSHYIESFEREHKLVRFYEQNASNGSFPVDQVNTTMNILRCHFDIELEDAIRNEPKFTNAVSLEMTHNEKMVMLVQDLQKGFKDIKDCKNLSAQIYNGELLAMIYDMLDQINNLPKT